MQTSKKDNASRKLKRSTNRRKANPAVGRMRLQKNLETRRKYMDLGSSVRQRMAKIHAYRAGYDENANVDDDVADGATRNTVAGPSGQVDPATGDADDHMDDFTGIASEVNEDDRPPAPLRVESENPPGHWNDTNEFPAIPGAFQGENERTRLTHEHPDGAGVASKPDNAKPDAMDLDRTTMDGSPANAPASHHINPSAPAKHVADHATTLPTGDHEDVDVADFFSWTLDASTANDMSGGLEKPADREYPEGIVPVDPLVQLFVSGAKGNVDVPERHDASGSGSPSKRNRLGTGMITAEEVRVARTLDPNVDKAFQQIQQLQGMGMGLMAQNAEILERLKNLGVAAAPSTQSAPHQASKLAKGNGSHMSIASSAASSTSSSTPSSSTAAPRKSKPKKKCGTKPRNRELNGLRDAARKQLCKWMGRDNGRSALPESAPASQTVPTIEGFTLKWTEPLDSDFNSAAKDLFVQQFLRLCTAAQLRVHNTKRGNLHGWFAGYLKHLRYRHPEVRVLLPSTLQTIKLEDASRTRRERKFQRRHEAIATVPDLQRHLSALEEMGIRAMSSEEELPGGRAFRTRRKAWMGEEPTALLHVADEAYFYEVRDGEGQPPPLRIASGAINHHGKPRKGLARNNYHPDYLASLSERQLEKLRPRANRDFSVSEDIKLRLRQAKADKMTANKRFGR